MNYKQSWEKDGNNWGTEESYFPFKVCVATLSDEEIKKNASFTSTQRLEWVLMMHRLLSEQYGFKSPKIDLS